VAAVIALISLSFAYFTNTYGNYKPSRAGINFHFQVLLHKAQMLMVQEGVNASSAALRVGDESPSQFSGEFKRLFVGGPPALAGQLRKN